MYSPLSTGGLCCCPHGRLLNPATCFVALPLQWDPAFVFAPILVCPKDEDAEQCERKDGGNQTSDVVITRFAFIR